VGADGFPLWEFPLLTNAGDKDESTSLDVFQRGGKSAVAQDEWLELNNKKFSNLPSVQTLDGMRRQGNYIGMTQRCKRFLETVYSAGAITVRKVY
jgi:hypothetical protein